MRTSSSADLGEPVTRDQQPEMCRARACPLPKISPFTGGKNLSTTKTLEEKLKALKLTEADRKILKRICCQLSRLPFVKRILLYGSKARGDWEEESDLDLLVLVEGLSEERKRKVREIVYQAMWDENFPVFVSTMVYDEEKFFQLCEMGIPFALNAVEEGVELWAKSTSRV